jgi:hypothetical protein
MNNNNNEKAELLIEFIKNDPYLAFFIPFFHDLGIGPLIFQPLQNPYTHTKFYAIDKKTIVIEQNHKRLEIKIKQAKKILEDTFGPIPLEIY